jgi:hypothetical protein
MDESICCKTKDPQYHLYKYSAIVGKQMPTGVDKAILNSFSFTSVMIERNCRIN